MEKCTAIYVRISTSNKGQTTENQLLDIMKYVEKNDDDKPILFDDSGISGAKESRPQLDQLMEMVRQNKIKRIYVARFDRFARSTQHLLSALKEFQKYNVDFISISEGIDTSTSVGKMVFTFLGAIAEFERELIRERIQAGLRRARKNNIKLGRPRTGFDFEKAIQLRKEGLGFLEISKKYIRDGRLCKKLLTFKNFS